MKRYFLKMVSVVLAMVLCFSMAACGGTPNSVAMGTDSQGNVTVNDPLEDEVVTKPVSEDTDLRNVGYYTDWSVYGRSVFPSQINGDLLTHLNLAFANLNADGTIAIGDSNADLTQDYGTELGGNADDAFGVYGQLRQLKQKYPHLKTLISVGGWTWSGNFSDVAADIAKRDTFASSAAEFVSQYGFDGVDIDWEYPVEGGNDIPHRPEDKHNYTMLLKALRKALNEQGEKDGKTYLLTIAAGGSDAFINNTELTEIIKYVDYINIMSYDIHGSWDSNTSFNAPMFANEAEPNDKKEVCVDSMITAFLNAGVPAKDLNMGLGFYGRGWQGVGDTNNGLFQPGTAPTTTGFGKGTWEGAVFDLWDIQENYIDKEGFVRYYDETAQMPYIYNGDIFISYEDEQSITYKAQYILDKGLGGAMFWEFAGDKNLELQTCVAQTLGLPNA